MPENDRSQEVEPEENEHTLESKEPSLAVSSIAKGVEKPEIVEGDGHAGGAVEYPKGIEMFFIMLALMLSITLCALDQVSSATSSLSQSSSPTYHTPVR
jgi:hypothetical protein